MKDITPITITTQFSKGFIIIAGMLLIFYLIFKIDEFGLFSLIFTIFSCLCCGMGQSIKENQQNKIVPVNSIQTV